MALIKFSTPPTLAGLFFCLAPAEGAGLFFFGLQRISHMQAFTAAFIPSMQLAKTSKAFTGLYSSVSVNLTIPAHTIQQPHKPPIYRLRHAGWHTVKRSTSIDTRYHRHAGRCTDQHSRPIIIRYIRMQRRTPVIDPCPAVQHSADHASGGGSVHPACILCRVSAW